MIFVAEPCNLWVFSLQPSSNLIALSVSRLASCSTFLFALKAGRKACQGLQLYRSMQGWVTVLETIWVLLFKNCCHCSRFLFLIKTNVKISSLAVSHCRNHALSTIYLHFKMTFWKIRPWRFGGVRGVGLVKTGHVKCTEKVFKFRKFYRWSASAIFFSFILSRLPCASLKSWNY